ncbi:hypothetical protein ACVJBD_000319 [Rhizobium mongolense]
MAEAVGFGLSEHPLPQEENVRELFRASRSLYAKDPSSAGLAPLGRSARKLLAEVSNTNLRSKLIICALMHKPDRQLQTGFVKPMMKLIQTISGWLWN